MAKAKTVKKATAKKSKKEEPILPKLKLQKKSAEEKKRSASKPISTPQQKIMYTYVLKDLVRLIYKIGKTTNPHARFKSLCSRGKVVPIALVNKDVERILHDKYAANRMVNEEYADNGKTEWFRTGGIFDAFVNSVDTGKVYPFISIIEMVHELLEECVLVESCPNTTWEIEQSKYGYYWIGLEIIVMLGYVQRSGNALKSLDEDNIFMIGNKIAISEQVIDRVKTGYNIILAADRRSHAIVNNATETSRLRRVDLRGDLMDSEVFLLLNKVL